MGTGKIRLYSKFVFFLSIGLLCQALKGDISHAGTDEEDYLRSTSTRLLVAQDHLFYEFRDLIFKKYCSEQASEIESFMTNLYPVSAPSTLQERRGQQNSFILELLPECSNQDKVTTSLDQFNEFSANLMQNLLERIGTLMNNPELEQSFQARAYSADSIIEVELKLNFNAEKIFQQLTQDPKNHSLINLQFLEQAVHTTSSSSILAAAFAELELTANAEQTVQKKKNHCSLCAKKLNLIETTVNHCACNHDFCTTHRLPENHNCPVDRKTTQREELKKHNPGVTAEKIRKI